MGGCNQDVDQIFSPTKSAPCLELANNNNMNINLIVLGYLRTKTEANPFFIRLYRNVFHFFAIK